MRIERIAHDGWTEENLPDGSRLLVDHHNGMVFALSAPAGAAWDACRRPTTLAGVAQEMRQALGGITDELAEEAIFQLRERQLVRTTEPTAPGSRRAFLAAMGAAAVPLVVCLTAGDQRAHAQQARSAPSCADCR